MSDLWTNLKVGDAIQIVGDGKWRNKQAVIKEKDDGSRQATVYLDQDGEIVTDTVSADDIEPVGIQTTLDYELSKLRDRLMND